MKKTIHHIAIIFAIAFSSCKDDVTKYNVDEKLDPYLQLFLEEGAKRGINIDVEKNGLIMEFTQLPDLTIGLCTYQDPLLVQIDRDYWSETTDYEDQENLRQNVVFHELGHGLLNRGHDNSYLPNLEWKTIMCGGDNVEGRDWAINFNGYRKEYYIDELFNTKTPAPEWSQKMTFDGNKGELVKELSTEGSYSHEDEDGTTYLLHNGIYSISSSNDKNSITLLNKIKMDNDFYYEVVMNPEYGTENSASGICAIYDYNKDNEYNPQKRDRNHPVNDGCNYLAIGKEENSWEKYYLVNTNCFLPTAQIKGEMCNSGEYNTYAIARHDGELFFFINNELVFRNDYQADQTYIGFGILLPAKGKVSIKSSRLYSLGNVLRSGKTTEKNGPEEFQQLPISKKQNRYLKDYRK